MYKIIFLLFLISSSLFCKEIKISATNSRNQSVKIDSLVIINYNQNIKFKITDSLVDLDVLNSVDSKGDKKNEIISKLNDFSMSLIFNNFSSDYINIDVFNLLGQSIFANKFQLKDGSGFIDINLSNNHQNFYFVHFNCKDFSKTIKIIDQLNTEKIMLAKLDKLSSIDVYKITAYSKGYIPSIIDSLSNINDDLNFLMLDDFNFITKAKSVFKEISIDSAITYSTYTYHHGLGDRYYSSYDTTFYTKKFDEDTIISQTSVINDTFKLIYYTNFKIEFKPDYFNSKLKFFRLNINYSNNDLYYHISKSASIYLEDVNYQIEANKIIITNNFTEKTIKKENFRIQNSTFRQPAASYEEWKEYFDSFFDSDGKGMVKITIVFND